MGIKVKFTLEKHSTFQPQFMHKKKQFLCFNSVQSHKNYYDEVQAEQDAFLTSALDAEEWSLPRPAPLPPP